jgi:hypothetical protein
MMTVAPGGDGIGYTGKGKVIWANPTISRAELADFIEWVKTTETWTPHPMGK